MTVSWLREMGHDVKDVRGTPEQGIRDSDAWKLATAEARTFLTTDKGFVGYRMLSHHGLLVVRLRQPNRMKIHRAVVQALERFAGSEWPNLQRSCSEVTGRVRAL